MVDGVKSGRQIKEAKTWQFLWFDDIDEMIMDRPIQQSCFSGVMLAVGRLVGLRRPLETRRSVSRDFTTCSIILDMSDRLEIVCTECIVAKNRCVLEQELLLTACIGSRIWEIDWYQNEWPWLLFRGRLSSRDVEPLRQAPFAIEYLGFGNS